MTACYIYALNQHCVFYYLVHCKTEVSYNVSVYIAARHCVQKSLPFYFLE